MGAGLIYTWDIDTGLGRIIGYQIVYGVGTGVSVQVPVIVAGVVAAGSDKAIATATVLCEHSFSPYLLPTKSMLGLPDSVSSVFQFVSAAYGVGATDAILNNLLLSSLPRYLPGQDPEAVLNLGSSSLQANFQGDQLLGARKAYVEGLHGSWALAIALFGVAFLASLVPKSGGRMTAPSGSDNEKQQDSDENMTAANVGEKA